MIENMRLKNKSSFRIAALVVVALAILLVLSFQELGSISRIVLFLAGLGIGIGSLVALFSEPDEVAYSAVF